MVAVKVHETFDFPEIESDTIFLFLLKGFQKNGGLDLNLLSGNPFSGKVGGRLLYRTCGAQNCSLKS